LAVSSGRQDEIYARGSLAHRWHEKIGVRSRERRAFGLDAHSMLRHYEGVGRFRSDFRFVECA
jgi:hypothetical protein